MQVKIELIAIEIAKQSANARIMCLECKHAGDRANELTELQMGRDEHMRVEKKF